MEHQDLHNRYNQLAEKLLEGTISDEEKREYIEWLNSTDESPLVIPEHFAKNEGELESRMLASLQAAIRKNTPVEALSPRRFSIRKLPRYAAAAIIIALATTIVFFLSKGGNNDQSLTLTNNRLPADAVPGHDGAVLTLADGKKVVLDSLGNGAVITQGKTTALIRNGKLVYGAIATMNEVMVNTISTPRGRQYQLILSDGTKVWLNAESSIRFPTQFSHERRVEISGEAYFEVARNKAKPFIVDVNGKSSIEVLGTSFNAKAFADDGTITTTLVEGSIRLSSPSTSGASESVIMHPGEQTKIFLDKPQSIAMEKQADLESALAWRNGLFSFHQADIKAVMRQLSRWYDVEVIYTGAVPSGTFSGEIGRGLTLSQVLKGLSQSSIHFEIEGKKIRIMP